MTFTIGIPLVKSTKSTENHAKITKIKISQREIKNLPQILFEVKSMTKYYAGSLETLPGLRKRIGLILHPEFFDA